MTPEELRTLTLFNRVENSPDINQRKLAEDCVNGYLFQLAKAGVARHKLKGLWQNWPMFVNDMAAVYWEE